MKYKELDNGFKIPVLGLGTWQIGGQMEADYSKDKEGIQAIKDAIGLGYIHIDTAEVYGAGHTEELVGEAIKDFDRTKLFITTKVFKTHLKYDEVISSCQNSLKKLQTDYIDLYLIHASNPEVHIEETMKAMDYLVEQKLVKNIGVSNFSVEQMKEAQSYSKNKIVANQIPYNLNTREEDHKGNCNDMESEIIPYCQENDIIVLAYRPIERGFSIKPNPVMDKLAEKYGKTKAQIAISWLISKKNIVTIPKSINIKHLKENLDSIDFNLSDEDIKLLDETKFEKPQT